VLGSAVPIEPPICWSALVDLLNTQQMQSQDRGLKELILAGARGAERAQAARSLLAPLVVELLHRAKDAGVIRGDIEISDIPLIQLAIGTIAESSRDVAPDVWRRMMTLVLDGLRAESARGTLAAPALDQEQVDAVLACYGASRRRT